LTVLTFTDFRIRKAVAQHFQNADLQFSDGGGKRYNIAIKPAAPRYQRKLEGVLRALLGCVSRHPDFKGHTITVLWQSLTMLMPQNPLCYDPQHEAWAHVKYEEDAQGLKVGVYIHKELAPILGYLEDPSKPEETLWYHEWYRQFWRGQQHDHDTAEDTAQAAKNRRWTDLMVASGSSKDGFPLPITITKVDNGYIEYSKDDYNYKMEKLGLYTKDKRPRDQDAEMTDTQIIKEVQKVERSWKQTGGWKDYSKTDWQGSGSGSASGAAHSWQAPAQQSHPAQSLTAEIPRPNPPPVPVSHAAGAPPQQAAGVPPQPPQAGGYGPERKSPPRGTPYPTI
jgi:hypothetical protein